MADIRHTAVVDFKVEGTDDVTKATGAINDGFDKANKATSSAGRALDSYGDKVQKAGKLGGQTATALRAQGAAAQKAAKDTEALARAVSKSSAGARPATKRLADLKDGVIQLANASLSSKSGFTDSLQAVENFGRALPGVGLAIGVVAVGIRLGAEAFFKWRETATGASTANNVFRSTLEGVKKTAKEAVAELTALRAVSGDQFATLNAAERVKAVRLTTELAAVTSELNAKVSKSIALEAIRGKRQSETGEAHIDNLERQTSAEIDLLDFKRSGIREALRNLKVTAQQRAVEEGLAAATAKTVAATKKQLTLLQEFARLDLRPLSDVLGVKETSSDMDEILTRQERFVAGWMELGSIVGDSLAGAGAELRAFSMDLADTGDSVHRVTFAEQTAMQATDALATGFANAAAAAIFYGDSVLSGINGAMQAIAFEATARALFEGATAAAFFAWGNPLWVKHAESAAGYAAAAVAASSVAGVTGGFSGAPTAGGGGGGGGADGGGGGAAPSQSDFGGSRGDAGGAAVINVNNFDGHFYATTGAALRGLGAAAIEGANTQGRGAPRLRSGVVDSQPGRRIAQRGRR